MDAGGKKLVADKMFIKSMFVSIVRYGMMKSISTPRRARARARFRHDTPRPPLLCGGSSQPNISTFISSILSHFVIE